MPSAVDTIKPLVLARQSSKDCSRKSPELFFQANQGAGIMSGMANTQLELTQA